jgi:large subunit ribosomal protein L22
VQNFRYLRVAPRKVRLVADQVRGLPVQQALDLLTFARKSSAEDLLKLIRSAVANADQKQAVSMWIIWL